VLVLVLMLVLGPGLVPLLCTAVDSPSETTIVKRRPTVHYCAIRRTVNLFYYYSSA
jgi:hypothetical protein